MKRDQFIKTSVASVFGISIVSGGEALATLLGSTEKGLQVKTAGELNIFLRSLAEVDEPSVDRIIIGDPETKIKKIATCWLPDWNTLQQAAIQGANVMVVHEPTFYTHWDLEETTNDFYKASDHARKQYIELVEKKKKWISERGLVIIRCHDVLDKISEIGIPFALGGALGFADKDIRTQTRFYNVYNIQPVKAIDAARSIARKLKPLNQPGVGFYGDEDRMVSSVGVGTGCICDPLWFSHLEPDLFIAINDIVRTWIQTSFANDSGKPLVVIDHGTAEESGMRLLSELLQSRMHDLETIHFQQGCTYKWVT